MKNNEFISSDVSIGHEYNNREIIGEMNIRYLDETFLLHKSNKNISFSSVISFQEVRKAKFDKGKKFFLNAFWISGSLSAFMTLLKQKDFFDVSADFVLAGLFWGTLAYVVGTFIQVEKVVCNIHTSNSKHEILLSKTDYLRLEKIFKERDNDVTKQTSISTLFNTDNFEATNDESLLSKFKYDELIRLKSLFDQQVINEKEFQLLKQEILSKNR